MFQNYENNVSIPIYRYHASQEDGVRYMFNNTPMIGEGWTLDGIAFRAPQVKTE